MKRDSERKALYEAKLHELKNRMHVHVSKELKKKLNSKARAQLVKKGDTVKVLRGSLKGKSGKVAKVNYNALKLFIEGVTRKNAKGADVLIPFQASNLVLLEVAAGKEKKVEAPKAKA